MKNTRSNYTHAHNLINKHKINTEKWEQSGDWSDERCWWSYEEYLCGGEVHAGLQHSLICEKVWRQVVSFYKKLNFNYKVS